MSVFNKPDDKTKIVSNTPSVNHKKNNSLNFPTNTGKFAQDNINKTFKNKLDIKNTSNDNIENNVINNDVNENSNINKLLTTTNKNSKKIEININKNYSPTTRLNRPNGKNIILLKDKQSTSQSNMNNKISLNDKNNNKLNKYVGLQ